ncbi:uncharacterized protein FOMMEDRAFT_168770 [Fomitiporia mediterranea MF3/22]|uniref:uncharacterized protein n=1 Tax=Fomitiporia mediterranea (strain MF3/22) TaxID=694068 RepID=UPI00044088DD|nr:uncharacterized protein FOMMEDRAFT_168770 [Fomitiporia mediterranea MF3/22]EJD02270.1 hypothetical protein FOMMEDRAFT_168770 [Fomitiporia mediterranea MF3/22]
MSFETSDPRVESMLRAIRWYFTSSLQWLSNTNHFTMYVAGRVTFWTGTISSKSSDLIQLQFTLSDHPDWSIITLLDYILILRVAALYGQKDKILDVCLKLLLVAQSAGSLGVLIYFTFVENPYALNLTTGITVCTLTVEPPRELAIAWALPTAYGFLLLCLTLYKAAEFSRRSAGFKGFQLVRIIVQDQTTYYCFLIAIAALRIATVFVRDIGIALVLIAAASPVLLSILGDQLLINLKEAGARCLDDEASYWVDNLDGSSNLIEFSRCFSRMLILFYEPAENQ